MHKWKILMYIQKYVMKVLEESSNYRVPITTKSHRTTQRIKLQLNSYFFCSLKKIKKEQSSFSYTLSVNGFLYDSLVLIGISCLIALNFTLI